MCVCRLKAFLTGLHASSGLRLYMPSLDGIQGLPSNHIAINEETNHEVQSSMVLGSSRPERQSALDEESLLFGNIPHCT